MVVSERGVGRGYGEREGEDMGWYTLQMLLFVVGMDVFFMLGKLIFGVNFMAMLIARELSMAILQKLIMSTGWQRAVSS